MAKDQEYHPLNSDPSADGFEGEAPPLKPSWLSRFKSRRVLAGLLAVETVVLTLAIFALFARGPRITCTIPIGSQVLYSPALDVVENEVQVYNVGFTGRNFPFPTSCQPG
ncbi:hypothetical protein DFH09DRAFT_1336435 [Mycena vulgaris]|nr:hypothetical protein DFH09DRAFT_1336435 [Mycena vulgaris]